MTHTTSETIAVEFQDQVTQIFVSYRTTGCLYLVLDFTSPLRPDVIRQATRRLLDAEPVLGCRFDDSSVVPVWRRFDDLDSDPGFAMLDDVQDVDGETAKSASVAYDARHGRNLTVRLLRHRDGDRLIFGISHVVADGGALVLALERFAALYSGIATDPDFRLPANTASRDSSRWLADFSLRDKLKVLWRDLADLRRGMRRHQGFMRPRAAFATAPRTRPALATLNIPADRLAEIDAMAKASALSRNDLLLAGYARAFTTFCRGDANGPVQIIMPINMRRYTEVESRPAICNLGGIANVYVQPDLGARFRDTLDRVAREMARQRGAFIGAANPLFVKMFAAMPYARQRRTIDRMMEKGLNKPVPPTFTNVGQIQERRIRFAGSAPHSVALYGMPLSLPLVVVAATEYRRSMTLTMSYDLDDYPAADVERFLAAIADGIEI
jgi:NRPS condensation-like uncharacterized protein